MATGRTVRQVKHGEKLRRSQNSLTILASPEPLIGCDNVKKLFKKKSTGTTNTY